MSGGEVYLYIGAAGGWVLFLREAVIVLSRRAYQADYKRAERVASEQLGKAYSEYTSDIGAKGPSFAARCALLAVNIDIADLVLIDRYSYQAGFKDLVRFRQEEIEAWRAKRRRQPLHRLFAFIRSATVG